MEGHFDFIVVGGGSAGCVLAARLAACGAHRVLLLEAGGEAKSPWIHVPLAYPKLLGDARYNWMYETVAEPGLGGRALEQPCGRVIGGSGSINAMVQCIGNPADYDRWRELGNRGWGWEDVRPWLAKLELPATTPQRHPLADAFIDAAVQAGHARNDGFNGAGQEGAGYFRLNIRKGRRASTASVYLEPLRRRSNLAVVTHAVVSRIILEQGTAVGVEYARGETRHVARAAREVILAAGAFNSPQILQRSGIGPGKWLQELGIPVSCDAPAVGENLQNHFRAPLVWRCVPGEGDNAALRSLSRQAAMALRYALFRDGPLATSIYAGGFFRSRPQRAAPDIQVTFWTFSVEKRDARGVVLHDFPGCSANAVLLNPRSRGSVRARSARTEDAPEIRYNFLCDPADTRTLVDGVRLVREIFAKPAMASRLAGELAPGAECSTDEALTEYARAKGGSVYHPVGTCALGTVLDSQLRVRGVGRLRVADASVMPLIPSGNTNAPTLMIAERAAAWLLDEARAGAR